MIDYSEDWLVSLLFQWKGSVAVRACLFAIPSALVSLLLVMADDFSPTFREDFNLMELSKSQLWAATTAILGTLLGFRTNRAMARFWEGTGLLHQMRGEWFDSISCCVTFSVGAVATKRKEVFRFRHTIVRLMSLCHGSALEEIAGNNSDPVETIDPLGLDNATLMHLKDCKEVHDFNRVEVLLHLTQSIITKSLDDGILKIPPPILSRVYQTLSRGFVNLLNAKKIADTRFPFPYAQLITMLLFMHLLLTPMMISCLIKSKVWAPIFTFVPIFAEFSINFIGVELENPFGTDDNDLPLAHFQGEMNKCLMMLLQEGADLIAGVSESRCIMDYAQIAQTLSVHGEEELSQPLGKTSRCSVSNFQDFVDVSVDDDLLSESTPPPSAPAQPAPAPPPPKEEKKVEAPLATPKAPLTPKAETKALQPETLPGLQLLVEKQVQDLSRSIAALTEFSVTLPDVLDSMLLTGASDQSRSQWRSAMLRRAEQAGRSQSDEVPAGLLAVPANGSDTLRQAPDSRRPGGPMSPLISPEDGQITWS